MKIFLSLLILVVVVTAYLSGYRASRRFDDEAIHSSFKDGQISACESIMLDFYKNLNIKRVDAESLTNFCKRKFSK